MRPFDLTIPSGSVCPRRRAIRFRMTPWACAEGTHETPPPGSPLTESAHAPTPNRTADVATCRQKLILGLLRTPSPPDLISSGPEILPRSVAPLETRPD